MSGETAIEDCWICGSSAKTTELDHANRKFYQCTGHDCGEYDISWRAAEMKEADEQYKAHLQSLAKKHKESELIPQATVHQGKVETKLIRRENA